MVCAVPHCGAWMTGRWYETANRRFTNPADFVIFPGTRMSSKAPALPVRDSGTPVARPREAATLIIYRQGMTTIEVLMGERHGRHKFMPKRYVFPGGRVDPGDSRVRVGTALSDDVAVQLERKLTPARARAMAVAAVRETFEETGLIIGAPDPDAGRPVSEPWREFFAAGVAPALDQLQYIGRAVTPPFRPVRFNARFFMIESGHIRGDLAGSGELLDLRWFPIAEARELELPGITRKMLFHIEELLIEPPPRSAERPIPYFKHMGSYHARIDE